jgi:hypothetical protein
MTLKSPVAALDPKPTLSEPPSFNHLIGADEQRGRYGESKLLRGLQIDDQLKFGWLQDRQVVRLLARQNSADVSSRRAQLVGESRAIGD